MARFSLKISRGRFVAILFVGIHLWMACEHQLAWAIDSTWIFNGNGNWSDSVNWSNGEPTDETYNVLIDDGDSAVRVTLNQSRTIGSLTISEGDLLYLDAGTGIVDLTVIGGILNHGSLYVENSQNNQVSISIGDATFFNATTGKLDLGGQTGNVFYGNLINEGDVDTAFSATFVKPGGVYTNRGTFRANNLSIQNGTLVQESGVLAVWLFDGLHLENSTLQISGGRVEGSGEISLTGGSAINLTGGTLDAPIVGNTTVTQNGGISMAAE
jgi:hypothetical protein